MSEPSTEVGPGFLAFVIFFLLALALWLLMRNMFARMRRMNLAERAEGKRQREQEERRDADGSASADADGDRLTEVRDSGLGDGPEEGQGRGDEV